MNESRFPQGQPVMEEPIMEERDDPQEAERPAMMATSRPLKRSINKLPWDDLSDEEKIGRLHGVVKDQQRIIEHMGRYVNQLIDHQHLDGHIVKRVEGYNNIKNEVEFKRDRPDEWF